MSQYSCLEIIAIIILSFYGLKFLISVFTFIWSYFLANSLGFGVKWLSGKNVWAVITGGTDGIGLQYAKQLAKKGYSLMIISRSEDKLNSVAKTLKEENPNCNEIRIITADFSKTDIYNKIESELNKLDLIDVLVNNVGYVYETPEYFTKIPPEVNKNYFNVNMFSYIQMIQLILPKMVEKRRGVIINVTSQAGENPVPLMAGYSATKAFLNFLSEALSVEYESRGVIIQTFVPSLVKTKLSASMDVPFFGISPQDCVSSAIKTVGIESYTYGHWRHRLMACLAGNTSSLLGRRLSMRLALNSMKPYRDEYYKKHNLTDDF